MKDYFLDLFEYDLWANSKVAACLTQQPMATRNERILSLFGHILAAQFVWISRIVKEPIPSYPLWGTYTLPQITPLILASSQKWRSFIAEKESFRESVSYKNTQGAAFTSSLESILLHVFNHGTYHRGQIAWLLRTNGFEPVNTDYITYDRDPATKK